MRNKKMDFTDANMLRIKAEKVLTKKKKDNPSTETDIKKLLHELQVHQIELEMQNEELRSTYEISELALKRYTLLYDFAPMGYFTINSDGFIKELNFRAAKIFQNKRFKLIGHDFKLFISKETLPAFNLFLSKVFASNKIESCEVMLVYDNFPLYPVFMEGFVIGNDQECLLTVIDLTNSFYTKIYI